MSSPESQTDRRNERAKSHTDLFEIDHTDEANKTVLDLNANRDAKIEVPAPEPIADVQSSQIQIPLQEEPVGDQGEIQLAIDFQKIEITEETKRTRYLSADAKQTVRSTNADQGREFEDLTTGRTCGSRHQEQFDHIKEFSNGGSNQSENLRVYCAKHNRFRWREQAGSHVRADYQAYA